MKLSEYFVFRLKQRKNAVFQIGRKWKDYPMNFQICWIKWGIVEKWWNADVKPAQDTIASMMTWEKLCVKDANWICLTSIHEM